MVDLHFDEDGDLVEYDFSGDHLLFDGTVMVEGYVPCDDRYGGLLSSAIEDRLGVDCDVHINHIETETDSMGMEPQFPDEYTTFIDVSIVL